MLKIAKKAASDRVVAELGGIFAILRWATQKEILSQFRNLQDGNVSFKVPLDDVLTTADTATEALI